MVLNAKILAVAPALVLLWSCGYVGDPMPPALNIPVPITDLRASEVGDRIVVKFTLPAETTEQTVQKAPGKLELRAGAWTPGQTDVNSWVGGAREIPIEADEFGPVDASFAAADFVGTRLALAVRSAGSSDRFSAWSNVVVLDVVAPLAVPQNVHAASDALGAKVSWKLPASPPAGLSFDVLRKGEGDKEAVTAGASTTDSFVDEAAEYGKKYEYTVRAVQKTADSTAVSELSPPVTITPADTFPPAVPSGVTLLAGMNNAELNWDRVIDRNLAGYRVYRADNGGDFRPISELLPAPGFGDKDLASGHKYRYRVTAVDGVGNESAPSEVVEIAVP